MKVTSARRHLLLHGGLVLIIGLIAGLPMAEAIEADSPDAIRAWRAAHVGGVTRSGAARRNRANSFSKEAE